MEYLNLFFLQPQPQQYSLPIVLAIGGLLGALLTGGINIYITRIKISQTVQAKKFKTYSQLIGQKKMLMQTFSTCGDYRATIEYNQAMISYLEDYYKDNSLAIKHIEKLTGSDTDLRKLHDRAIIDLTKAKERWWMGVGLILALYNNSDQIEILMDKAKKIEKCEKKIEDFIEKLDEVNDKGLSNVDVTPNSDGTRLIIRCSWLKDRENELHVLVDDDLEKSIDDFTDIVMKSLNGSTGRNHRREVSTVEANANKGGNSGGEDGNDHRRKQAQA